MWWLYLTDFVINVTAAPYTFLLGNAYISRRGKMVATIWFETFFWWRKRFDYDFHNSCESSSPVLVLIRLLLKSAWIIQRKSADVRIKHCSVWLVTVTRFSGPKRLKRLRLYWTLSVSRPNCYRAYFWLPLNSYNSSSILEPEWSWYSLSQFGSRFDDDFACRSRSQTLIVRSIAVYPCSPCCHNYWSGEMGVS